MLCVSEPRAVEMQTETLGKQPLFDRVRNRFWGVGRRSPYAPEAREHTTSCSV